MNRRLTDRISVLSQLARIDGDFDLRELTFIYGICIRNKIELDDIPSIISQPQPIISVQDLSANDKVNYLTDIILLMLIDGKVLPSEVKFSLDIARRLGYDTASTRILIDEICDADGMTEDAILKKVSALQQIKEQ